MKTFIEWLEENHPEEINEGFWKNLAMAGALGAGAMGAYKGVQSPSSPQHSSNPAAVDIDPSDWPEIPSEGPGLKKFKATADKEELARLQRLLGDAKGMEVYYQKKESQQKVDQLRDSKRMQHQFGKHGNKSYHRSYGSGEFSGGKLTPDAASIDTEIGDDASDYFK